MGNQKSYLIDFDLLTQTDVDTKAERKIWRHEAEPDDEDYLGVYDEDDDKKYLKLMVGQIIRVQKKDEDEIMGYGTVVFADGEASKTKGDTGWVCAYLTKNG